MREKFVYDAEIGDNTKFVYAPKMEQKAKFVYKELSEIVDFEHNKWIGMKYNGGIGHEKKYHIS